MTLSIRGRPVGSPNKIRFRRYHQPATATRGTPNQRPALTSCLVRLDDVVAVPPSVAPTEPRRGSRHTAQPIAATATGSSHSPLSLVRSAIPQATPSQAQCRRVVPRASTTAARQRTSAPAAAIAMSLLIAPEKNRNSGLKARIPAAARATAGRSGNTSRASAQVASTATSPKATPARLTRRAARTVPRQGQSRSRW